MPLKTDYANGAVIDAEMFNVPDAEINRAHTRIDNLALDSLSDVATAGSASGKFLGYDAAQGLWVPLTPPTGGGTGGTAGVTSVNGATGVVTIDKTTVGLAAVQNLAPTAMPVSTAQQTAIDTAIGNLINGAPGALDTIGELAARMATDETGVTALTNTVAGKTSRASAETVTGAWTFTSPVGGVAPTADSHFVTRAYYAANLPTGGATATNAVAYTTQSLTAAQRRQARLNIASSVDGAAHFHVADYGALGDGTTDDRPAFAACLAAAVAFIQSTGAQAVFDFSEMGVCLFNSGVSKTAASVQNSAGTGATIDATATDYSSLGLPVPPGLPARLTFRGVATRIKLTTNCVCFAWPDKTRDYQVWQNLFFDRVTVDDNNIISTTKTRGHVIFGNQPAWGVKMRYTSLQDFDAYDCEVLNAATDTSTTVGAGATNRVMFHWSGDHNASGEATQTWTKRIRTRGGYQAGGDGMYNFFSTVADRYHAGGSTLGGVNHYYDEIEIGDGWRHINAVPQTQQRFQTTIYIGGSGKGERFSIGKGYCENIGDDVIEVGGMTRGTITEPVCKDPFFNLILFRNTGPMDATDQLIVVRRARTTVTPNLSGTTGAFAAPFAWISDDLYLLVSLSGTVTGGSFTLTIPLATGSVTTAAIAYNATAAQIAAAVDAVVPINSPTAPNGGVTGYTGTGALSTTNPLTFVLVSPKLSTGGKVTATSSLTGTNAAVTVGLSPNGTGFGRFIFEDPVFIADGLTSSRQGRTDFLCKGPGLGVPILGIDLIRPRVEFSNFTYDGSASNWELFMLLHVNPLYANFPLRAIVQDASIKADGCNLAASTGTGFMFMAGVEGMSPFLDVDGMETDFTGSSGGTWGHVMVGRNSGSGIRVIASRLKPRGQPSSAAYAGLRVGAEGLVTWARLKDSDFTSFGNQANGLVMHTSGTNYVANTLATRASGNIPDVVVLPIARTASFTVAQADSGAPPIQVNAASAVTITVPQLLAGSTVTFVRTGAGAVTLTAGSGVTLVLPAGATAGARVQGSSLSLTWLTATSVLLEGDLG